MYSVGMLGNAKLCRDIYKGWSFHVYCDPEIYIKFGNKLKNEGAQVLSIENPKGMFSRVIPFNNKDGVTIFRDADSRLHIKEKSAVDEWLKSDLLGIDYRNRK